MCKLPYTFTDRIHKVLMMKESSSSPAGYIIMCLLASFEHMFVFDSLHPSQLFFSNVRLSLPGFNQY